MELLLLEVFSFLRPIMFMDVDLSLFGMGFFDIVGVVFILLLMFAVLVHMSYSKELRWSGVDILIFLFVFWSIAGFLIYPETTSLRDLVKWTAPFITYLAAKNIIKDRSNYLNLVFFLIVGLSIPIIVSAVMIWLDLDRALDFETWSTKQRTYKGAFQTATYLGIVPTYFIVFGLLFAIINNVNGRTDEGRVSKTWVLAYFLVIPAAIYCLIQSTSRTSIIGLIIFFVIYLSFVNKKWLIVWIAGLAIAFIIMAPRFILMFKDVVEILEGTQALDKIMAGRPVIWKHNLSRFSKLSFDRQLAGAGIGIEEGVGTIDSFWQSHSGYVTLLVRTGIIGLVLFLLIQFVLLKKILTLEGKERCWFLAFIFMVFAMNIPGGSYVSHHGIAQLFYLLMAYVELQQRQNVQLDIRVPKRAQSL